MNDSILMLGDCLTELPKLGAESVDLIATDPPYGISFMGKDWDKAVPSVEVWKECLRVLKPGAFAFVMSLPRLDVLSQMAVRLQEAGFRVDFTPLYWVFASGFPKSMNVAKHIKKAVDRVEDEGWLKTSDDSDLAVIVDALFRRLRTEVGQPIDESSFARLPALLNLRVGKSDVSARIVEENYSEAPHSSKARTCIALVDAGTWRTQKKSFAITVGKESPDQSLSSILLTFAP